MYEQASERWSPVQSVEKVILSVISMLAGTPAAHGTVPGICSEKTLYRNRIIFLHVSHTRAKPYAEPNLESGANIDCCKLYRDNRAVSRPPPVAPGGLMWSALPSQEYERMVKQSIREQLGL